MLLKCRPQLRQQHIVMIFNIYSYKMMPSSFNSKINDTPQRFLRAYFEASLYFSLSEFTCP